MPKAGRIVTDPRIGVYCHVTLDSGEKIVVKHDRRDLLTIEVSKFMGFSSDRIFACNLDSPMGQRVLAWLTHGAEPGSIAATPLGATVEFVKDAESLDDLKRRCAVLMAGG